MKKLTLLIFASTTVLTLASCSTNNSQKANTTLTEAKYTKVVSELKTRLSSVSDMSWKFKKTKNITNADISKGIMIEVSPKSKEDSKKLEDVYSSMNSVKESSKSQINSLRKEVSDVAKTLPNDNIEISLGFESEQKSKGIVPVAESIKSMDKFQVK